MAFPYSLSDLLAAIQSNPIGTERTNDQSMTNVSPDTVPATTWGGYPVSQRLYNAGQSAIGNALGWVGGTDTPGIRAFHGSPYDFDAFDMSKIGTGEGAQAYGHGLYFAGNEGTATSYRDALAPPDFSVTKSGVPISSDVQRMLEDGYSSAQGMGFRNPSPNAALSLAQRGVQQQLKDAAAAGDFQWFNKASDHSAELARIAQDLPTQTGKMYEVNINASPTQLLDWDKPLSKQSPAVQDQMNAAIKDMYGGGSPAYLDAKIGDGYMPRLYQDFASKYGAAGAADKLRQAGIPGIQYLDQGSRAAGEGSRNYVMFDPSLVEILRKYLFPATTVGGTAALASQQGNTQ